MAPKHTFDVMTMPSERHADGTPNPCAPYLTAFVTLAEIIGEACEKVRLHFTLIHCRSNRRQPNSV